MQMPMSMRAFYQLPYIEDDEYNQYMNTDLSWDTILGALSRPEIEWMRNKAQAIQNFSSTTMDSDAKAWNYFIGARLMPLSHFSDVTKERVALIYAIQSGKSIDVRLVIQNQILHVLRSAQAELHFPSLITGLCKKASVVWGNNEELLHPKHLIDNNMIYSMSS